MSSKQLARTVADGRILTLTVVSGERLAGYLAGMDDYHWLVVDREAKLHLVHKGSASTITIGDASYDEEPLRDSMEKIIGPFRDSLVATQVIPERPRSRPSPSASHRRAS